MTPEEFEAWLDSFVKKLEGAFEDARATPKPRRNEDACGVLAAKAGTARFILDKLRRESG